MSKKLYRMSKKSRQLKALFHRRLDKWEIGERRSLVAKLLEWGSAAVSLGKITLWQMIEEQFQFKAEKMNISSKKIIEYLFDQKDSGTWMLKFQ